MRISDWSSDVCSSDLGVVSLSLSGSFFSFSGSFEIGEPEAEAQPVAQVDYVPGQEEDFTFRMSMVHTWPAARRARSSRPPVPAGGSLLRGYGALIKRAVSRHSKRRGIGAGKPPRPGKT